MKAKKEKLAANSDYTHISIILDRTGSMESIKNDTIGGFNAFLKDQQAQPGRATLTLVQFDSQDPYEVLHSMKPIAQIPPLDAKTYVPRASTPLLDAMGRGINDLAAQLSGKKAGARPGKVVVVIITDGQENASAEFKKDQIEKMIKAKEKAGWQFVFLSADLASIGEARSYGFSGNKVMAFDKSAEGSARMFCSLSNQVSAYREDYSAKDLAFSEDDRKKQKAEKLRKPPGK